MLKKPSQTAPEKHQPSGVDLYSAHDPIPVPEAIESDTDTAWRLWEDTLSLQNSTPTNGAAAVTEKNSPMDRHGLRPRDDGNGIDKSALR